MHRRPALPALLLLLPTLALAEAPVAQKTFLFKVEGKAGAQAWLFGSIHAADDAMYPLDPRVEAAFEESKVLVVEVDLEKVDSAKIAQMTIAKAAMRDGKTLSQVLTPKTKEAYEKTMASLGIPTASFEPFQPWFAAISVAALSVQKAGLDPEKGIDRHFLKKAGKRKVVELEGVERQLDVFAGFPLEQQDLLLRHAMTDVEVMQKELGRLVAAWKTGDLAETEKILGEAEREDPAVKPVMDAIFGKRNRDTAAKIEKMLGNKDREFVVVGAGHLVGKDGIPELLRKKGFKVTQQ